MTTDAPSGSAVSAVAGERLLAAIRTALPTLRLLDDPGDRES
jgi:hypothetical protein